MLAHSCRKRLRHVEIERFPIENFVAKLHLRRFERGDGQLHNDPVPIANGLAVVAFDVEYGRDKTPRFQVRIGKSQLSKILLTSILEVEDIVGMIDDTHHIGFAVADGYGNIQTHSGHTF